MENDTGAALTSRPRLPEVSTGIWVPQGKYSHQATLVVKNLTVNGMFRAIDAEGLAGVEVTGLVHRVGSGGRVYANPALAFVKPLPPRVQKKAHKSQWANGKLFE